MSTTVTIPAHVIDDVRESLFCLLGDATQEIDVALLQPERELHPEWFQKDHRRLEDAFALLDLIGWSPQGEPQGVEVEPLEYGRQLLEALDSYLPLLTDQAESAAADEDPPSRKGETTARVNALHKFSRLLERALAE